MKSKKDKSVHHDDINIGLEATLNLTVAPAVGSPDSSQIPAHPMFYNSHLYSQAAYFENSLQNQNENHLTLQQRLMGAQPGETFYPNYHSSQNYSGNYLRTGPVRPPLTPMSPEMTAEFM